MPTCRTARRILAAFRLAPLRFLSLDQGVEIAVKTAWCQEQRGGVILSKVEIAP